MLGLLESKLNSLPSEITKNYPDLIHISINDINPEILKINQVLTNNETNQGENQINNNQSNKVSNTDNNNNADTVNIAKEEEIEVNREPTAQEKLTKLVEENEDITSYYRMLKYYLKVYSSIYTFNLMIIILNMIKYCFFNFNQYQ
jgi:hypothetical protein